MKRKEFFELWIKALRSGKYKQTKGTLEEEKLPNKFYYCCLGVACVVAIENRKKVDYERKNYLPESMVKLLGIDEQGSFESPVIYRGRRYNSLASMNDAGVKFKTIARIIEEQLEAGNFRKP